MSALPSALDDTDASPFVRRDGKGGARLELVVKGAHCASCIAKIEGGLKTLNGVTAARLNLSTGKLSVDWRDGLLDPARIVAKVGTLGFTARPYDPQAMLTNEKNETRELLKCMAMAGFAAANVMLLSISIWAGGQDMGEATRTLFHWISALIAVPAALLAGRPFYASGWAALRHGKANMDVPISLAILLALALSLYQTAVHGENAYFDAAVTLPFLLLIGRYLDAQLKRKARSAARELVAMQAVTARRLDTSGHAQSVLARDIAVGDRLLVATGERIAVDGVAESDTEADLSLITGETAPVRIASGASLRAGSIVTGAQIVLKATARVEDSLVAELARLVEAGQQGKSRYVRLADRAARIYVPAVHSLALAVFIGWLLAGASLVIAAGNAISLLIITCPCALGLAVPAVQIVATGRLFRRGLLVKSGDALERLARADVAVFDKTGTLTIGRPALLDADGVPAEVLKRAARLARASRHPLARALAAAAGTGPVADGVRELAGQGLEAEIGGMICRLGRAEFVGTAAGLGNELWYREGQGAPQRFAFTDTLRGDAPALVSALCRRGLTVEMLSGDRAPVAAQIARAAGIAQVEAQANPAAKRARIEALVGHGHRVLMVGDGLNDAAALAGADVSISPGTAIDAAQAAADMVLQGEALLPIAEAIDVARAARRRVLENFAFAAAYNAVAVPLAAAGLVTPLIAAVAMASSSLLVTLNALRIEAAA